MNKVIMKRYVENEEWEETTLQDAVNHLEGYWTGNIESMLLDEGLTLWNPFAFYKAVQKEITEQQITEQMMKDFHFEYVASGKSVKCSFCKQRFSLSYYGKGVNERMIEHYNQYHSVTK